MANATQIKTFKRDNLLVDIIFQHKGEQNVISAKEITTILNENGYQTKTDHIHGIVKKMVIKRRLPICSANARGYYWATAKEEIQATIGDLQNRIAEMQKRIDVLKSFIIE